MNPFDERDTISVPVQQPVPATRYNQVVALRMYQGGAELELKRGKRHFTVGADGGCDVVVPDPYASAVHCHLERRSSGELAIRDGQSKNGTFVNGIRVEVAEVRPGALVRIGRTTLVALCSRGRGTLTAFEQLRGEDPGFRAAVDLAVRAASSSCSVLILGETGTGKDLVARAIHDASARAAGPFVALNCGAIPRELIASELFGHEKGSFTGAVGDHPGVFVRADCGTLFLDELGELPLLLQPHLLRVLEERMVRPVGGRIEQAIDVRVVAATNRVAKTLGSDRSPLRLDLYHRLATVVVQLPPLRERPGDVPILVRSFLAELARHHGPRSISRATMRSLCEYAWPGNVRELRQAVTRAVALSTTEVTSELLFQNALGRAASSSAAQHARETADDGLAGDDAGLRAMGTAEPTLPPLEAVIKDAVLDAFAQYGSIRRAARALGMPKSTFADRLSKYRGPV